MIADIPRISVLVITYNQEDVIMRAIGSLLSQKDYIYEICVSDDCSTDNTWNILQEYSNKYPGLFNLNRNDPNVGIFKNIEKTWEMPSGDVVYQLSGDDECGDGWFKKVIDYIKVNQVDYKNELFCIYGDVKEIYPDGTIVNYIQKMADGQNDLLKLGIRGLIGNRSACYSINVLKKFKKVSIGRSYKVECAQDRQLQMYSNRNYYVHLTGNIYYAGIGVSVKMSSKESQEESDEWKYLLDFLNSEGVILNDSDLNYLKFRTSFQKGRKIKALFYYIRSMERNILVPTLKLYSFKLLKKTPFLVRGTYNL